MVAAIDSPERVAHIKSEPGEEGLTRLREVLGYPHLEVLCRLPGGAVTASHLLRAKGDGETQLVLKRFMPGELNGARVEWERLELAAKTSIPTPEPLAFDEGGWFGGPCILTSALPGGPIHLQWPNLPDGWIEALAGTLVAIHATSPDPRSAPSLRRPGPRETRHPGDRLPADLAPRMNAAIDRLRTESTGDELVFSHGDFHTANVLFSGADVVGVVDWSGVKFQPAGADVAQCRCELAIWPGGDAPDVFLDSYRHLSGEPLSIQPLWDVLAADRALEWHHVWLHVYADLGVPRDRAEVQRALRGFVELTLTDHA